MRELETTMHAHATRRRAQRADAHATSLRTPLLIALTALAAALAPALLATSPAQASTGMPTMLQDDPQLIYGDQAQRDRRLDEFDRLGVDIVKVRVRWRDLAPAGRRKPAGFDGSNPDSYSADQWARYDAVVRGAQARGMDVLFQLGGTAPNWATGGNKRSPVYKPSATEFGRFVSAVSLRYSGNYRGLPRVSKYSVWNEPNLKSWLAPQSQAPRLYRNLLRAADNALDANGYGGHELLLGELLPFARSARETRNKIRPIAFLRELACVNKRYRRYTGRTAKRKGCANFKALPGTGLAYHPYTLAGGPKVRNRHPDDASIAELSRVTRALDKLRSRKRILRRRMPVWITEYGFQSDPPDRYATPIKRIPGFMGLSEYLAYRNGRVASYSQYPLIDDRGSVNGFQSGLRFRSGRAKRGVYNAFRWPFYVRRSGSRAQLFGGVRADEGAGSVTLESKVGKRGKWKSIGTVGLNSRGYFTRRVRVSRLKDRYFRFSASGVRSRTTKAD